MDKNNDQTLKLDPTDSNDFEKEHKGRFRDSDQNKNDIDNVVFLMP